MPPIDPIELTTSASRPFGKCTDRPRDGPGRLLDDVVVDPRQQTSGATSIQCQWNGTMLTGEVSLCD